MAPLHTAPRTRDVRDGPPGLVVDVVILITNCNTFSGHWAGTSSQG